MYSFLEISLNYFDLINIFFRLMNKLFIAFQPDKKIFFIELEKQMFGCL
jgi:hypothetical protein